MQELEERFLKMVNTYNRIESIDIEFVPGVKVSHLDAHLLALMYKNPLKKVTELAPMFGVTKGAVSQQLKKLEKKELIKRVRHNDNFREVYVELTASGIEAVKKHDEMHKYIFSSFAGILKSLAPENKKLMLDAMDAATELFKNVEKTIK